MARPPRSRRSPPPARPRSSPTPRPRIQLAGNTANPQATNQALTYQLLNQPQNGTVSNFNASTGTFTYTPNSGFTGSDALAFQVQYTSDAGTTLTSAPATETITVTGADTGAVRLIGNIADRHAAAQGPRRQVEEQRSAWTKWAATSR